MSFQHLKELKNFFIHLIGQQIREELDREISVINTVPDYQPIRARLTQIAGHWTLFGSVQIRLENFPVTYEGANYDVDFSILLLENSTGISQIASDEMILFNGASPPLADPEAFEIWIKKEIIQAWNDK